jgi:hypothetical protein
MVTLVRLDGAGPFQTPAVSSFLGAIGASKTQQVHIQLALEDGRELYIPIAHMAYEDLCLQFHKQHLLNLKK